MFVWWAETLSMLSYTVKVFFFLSYLCSNSKFPPIFFYLSLRSDTCANEDVDLLKMFNRTYVEVTLWIFMEHGVEFCSYLTCKKTGTSTCPK